MSPGQVHQVVLNAKPSGKVFKSSKAFLVYNNIAESYISNYNLFKSFGESPSVKINAKTFKRLGGVINEMEVYLNLEIEYQINAIGALLTLFLIIYQTKNLKL